MNPEQLRARLAELSERMRAIQNTADTATRDLTPEEATEIDNIMSEFDRTEADLNRRLAVAARGERLEQSNGRRTAPAQTSGGDQGGGRASSAAVDDDPDDPPGTRIQRARNRSIVDPAARPGAGGLPNTRLPTVQERGRWGFSHVGEFFTAVMQAKIKNQIDPRLIKNAATSFGQESVGEDGGFAIPPDWRTAIMELVWTEDALLAMTDQQTTTSNTIVVPVDETAAWHSNGVRAFWVDEATATTQTKPALKPLTVRANKLMALVYLTDELLEDAPAMGRYVTGKAPIAINWQINDALLTGSGAGKPLGILNAPALITVTAEGSQAAATILSANIMKMWSRCIAASRRRAVWIINQDIEPQLMQMVIPVKNVAGTENVGGWPLYVPPGGLSASPFGTLLGRPIVYSEAASTLGTVGDIILADMMAYMSVVKASGIRSDVSIHVEFERDIIAFRFILRIGGQPWLSAPIARKHGANTLSPFVALATRA